MTEAEMLAGKKLVEEIDEIQRKIDLIENDNLEVLLTLQGAAITTVLPTGYTIAEITEVVRSKLIVDRSLKQTELSNL